MPSLALRQIERGLTELDCPPAQLRRHLRELAEHHEDLKRHALEEGLSEAAAEAQADELLGEPAALAAQLAAALRQSSWWGRHPFIGFCLLPPFVIFSLFLLTLYFDYGICYVSLPESQIGSLSEGGRGLKFCQWLVTGNFYASMILTAALFAALARRTIAGIKWTLATCTACALPGAFFYITITPHNITLSLLNHLQWTGLLLPFAVGIGAWRRQRGSINALAPLPRHLRLSRVNKVAIPKDRRLGIINPTSIITALVLGLLVYQAIQIYREIYPPLPARSAQNSVRPQP
jgi:hypothetical protein